MEELTIVWLLGLGCGLALLWCSVIWRRVDLLCVSVCFWSLLAVASLGAPQSSLVAAGVTVGIPNIVGVFVILSTQWGKSWSS